MTTNRIFAAVKAYYKDMKADVRAYEDMKADLKKFFKLVPIIGFAVTIVMLISSLPSFLLYKRRFAPQRIQDINPCPLPEGSYPRSCANVASQLMLPEQTHCNFTATCVQDALANLLQDGRCTAVPLIRQDIPLPALTQFKGFKNEKGYITTQLETDDMQTNPYTWLLLKNDLDLTVTKKRVTSEVPDEDCKIRRQLSGTDKISPSVALSAAVVATALKLSA
jgi:hypothetical protein